MAHDKQRIEPEVNMSAEAGAEGDAPVNKVKLSDLSVEDLVPGLEEEIAKMQDDDPYAEKIAQLEAERDEFKDKWRRALAESENVRRRATRDRADAETYGGTRLARDLLSVYDNLERALEAADDSLRESAGAFIEGIELTQRELIHAFEKHKIQKVTPEIGEKFDPNRHQAMFEAPIPGAEPNTIIEIMQDGFVISDRLLRPALVGVAKAMPEAPPESPEAGDPDAGQD